MSSEPDALGVPWLSHALHTLGELHGRRSAGPAEAWADLLGHLMRAEAAYLRLAGAGGGWVLETAAVILDAEKERLVAAQDFDRAAGLRELAIKVRLLADGGPPAPPLPPREYDTGDPVG